jgi:hypothetical protein
MEWTSICDEMRGLCPLRGRCPKGYFMEIITKRMAYSLYQKYFSELFSRGALMTIRINN